MAMSFWNRYSRDFQYSVGFGSGSFTLLTVLIRCWALGHSAAGGLSLRPQLSKGRRLSASTAKTGAALAFWCCHTSHDQVTHCINCTVQMLLMRIPSSFLHCCWYWLKIVLPLSEKHSCPLETLRPFRVWMTTWDMHSHFWMTAWEEVTSATSCGCPNRWVQTALRWMNDMCLCQVGCYQTSVLEHPFLFSLSNRP